MLSFSVSLDNGVDGGFTVSPEFTAGTAGDSDFDSYATIITFDGTAGESHSLTVSTFEDNEAEGDETFIVSLTVSDTTVAVTATDSAIGTIIDDPPTPDLVAWLSISSGRMVEADALIYISARIENRGFGDALATTVRLYQSDQSADASIAASDTALWKAAVPALRAGETWVGDVPDYYAVEDEEYWQERIERGGGVYNAAVIAPPAPGKVFYWLCVDPVPGEVDMGGVNTGAPASAPNCGVEGGTLGSRTPSDLEYWKPTSHGSHSLILITDGEPSSYTDLAWVGENRIRVAHSEQSPRPVYVYEARYADQQTISVMIDQGFSRSRADELATFYARRVGQLPARSALDEFVVLVCCGTASAYADKGENRVAIFHYEWPRDVIGSTLR